MHAFIERGSFFRSLAFLVLLALSGCGGGGGGSTVPIPDASGSQPVPVIVPAAPVAPAAQVPAPAADTQPAAAASVSVFAGFGFPWGVVAAPDGALLVGDSQNNTVRKITSGGLVSTLPTTFAAKTGGSGGTRYVALDQQGTLFVTGSNILGSNPVYAVSASGQLRVFAQFVEVTTSLATGPDGKLYVGTQGSIAVINPDGVQGPKITGLDCTESSIAVSGSLLYVSCPGQHTVRSIDTQGRVAIVAGQFRQAGSTDGPAGEARLDTPQALALDSASNLYIADAGTIRRMTPGGDVRTIAVTANAPLLSGVAGLAWSAGMLYATVPQGVLKIGPLN